MRGASRMSVYEEDGRDRLKHIRRGAIDMGNAIVPTYTNCFLGPR